MSTRILLADDHKMVRAGFRHLLATNPDIKVVAEADNGREAVRLAAVHRPDVVLMDITMPELNGIEATRQIRKATEAIKVLILSVHGTAVHVIAALQAGASGYLLKDADAEELFTAIRAMIAGHVYLSPEVADVVVHGCASGESNECLAALATISPREREVLQLLAEGLGSKEIAAQLHVSVKTVQSHRERLMDRLDIHNVAGLTKFAIRHGLTTSDA